MSKNITSALMRGTMVVFMLGVFGLGVSLEISGMISSNAHASVICATGEIVEDALNCPSEVYPDCEGENCADGYTDGELTDFEAIDDTTVDRSDLDSEAEIVSEPVLWPVYLSLGTIAATLVLIFLINLIGRKKRKK